MRTSKKGECPDQLNGKPAARWKDGANLALGLWLVASPTALKLTGEDTAVRNAWGIGTGVAIAALAALIAFQTWKNG